MTATVYINGVIGVDTTLLDVIRQVKGFTKVDAVTVHIDSIGGSVDVGQSIYLYLRNMGVPVTTIAHQAYSIAASIFMAGDTRIVLEGADRLMIHMPWVQNAQGTSADLDNISKELKSIESEFIKFYSVHTNIDEDTIKSLLENEQFLSAQESFDLGLANQIDTPLKAVAYFDNPEKSSINKNVIMRKLDDLLAALKTFVPESRPEVLALVVQDANGVSIDFPEVMDGDIPEIGSKANVDGAPADGEYLMPDGSTLVFVSGELVEVKTVETTEEEPIEEAVATEEPVELNIEELLRELFAAAKDQAKEEIKFDLLAVTKTNEDLHAEIIGLKKLIGSDELSTTPTEKVEVSDKKEKGIARAAQILNSRRK